MNGDERDLAGARVTAPPRTTPRTTPRLALLALAVVGWLVCFAVLRRLGTWTPFAVVGPALAVVALATDADARSLLRPTSWNVAAGVAAGLIMVALTHAAFAMVARSLPVISAATRELFELLNVGGFSPVARAALIVIVASSEEVVFRGTLLGPPTAGQANAFHSLARSDRLPILALAAAYALGMATLGSVLLIACALACALLWGALRVSTRSLCAPIIAHVVWDLGVLVLWPLTRS